MRFLLNAPNVNNGGGLNLLQYLLDTRTVAIAWAQLDQRIKDTVHLPDGLRPSFVSNTLGSRLRAEWRLWRECKQQDTVLCFHGLPPLFPIKGRVVVFIQNRILTDLTALTGYPVGTRLRLWAERGLLRALRGRSKHYIVQTPSMAVAMRRLLSADSKVSVVPFAPGIPTEQPRPESRPPREFDFVYVASAEMHKNHAALLDAWRLLAEMGHRPSLALTIAEDRHSEICTSLRQQTLAHDLAIQNLGTIPFADVEALYGRAGALIYPSTCESLGLPLIEASAYGLPIVASELDYVRDAVVPAQTFDPSSPLSIARAVLRHLGVTAHPLKIGTAEDFLTEVLR